ncbi:helix-turn-helix transcriptional regulator [Vagococcus salmoninarum]|uniref:helix-turn-helix transcriptional regulator n=1 Tax=Vagococcus salmoninarum TaxID=2739 RepID=UPI003F9997F7
MCQNKKVLGYRNMLGLKQKDMASLLSISRQAYSEKERGNIPFKDSEKQLIKNMVAKIEPKVTIDKLFF